MKYSRVSSNDVPYSKSNEKCVASRISCERWNDAIRQLDERLIDCIEFILRAAVSFKLFICRNQFSPYCCSTETIYSIHFFDLFDDSLVFDLPRHNLDFLTANPNGPTQSYQIFPAVSSIFSQRNPRAHHPDGAVKRQREGEGRGRESVMELKLQIKIGHG